MKKNNNNNNNNCERDQKSASAGGLRRTNNTWLYSGERKITVIHTKLRMNCSSLKAHLFDHNIIQDSECECGHNYEDNSHYLLECRLYLVERLEMLNLLDALNFEVTLNFILNGNIDKDIETNNSMAIIFIYIKKSNRFDV